MVQPDLHDRAASTLPDGTAHGNRRRLARVTIQALLAAVLLWVIVRQIDLQAVWRQMARADAGLLTLSFALVLLRLPIWAMRWRVLLARRGWHFSVWQLTRVLFGAQAAATLLPAGSGLDLLRGYQLFRARVDARHVLETVMADRAAGALGLVVLSFPPAAWILWRRPDLAGVAIPVVALGAAAAAGVAIAPHPLARWGSGGEGRMRRTASAIATLLFDRVLLVKLVLLSVAFQIPAIAAVYVIGLAIGAAAPLFYYFLFMPLIWLWMMLPVSINAIGIRESAFVLYFGLIDMPAETALTIAAIVFAQTLLQGLLGLLVAPLPARESAHA